MVLCQSDNRTPEPTKTAYSCSQHGPVTAWFGSARPRKVVPVPKTFTVLGVGVHCRNGFASVKVKFCVCVFAFLEFPFVKNFITPNKLQSHEG